MGAVRRRSASRLAAVIVVVVCSTAGCGSPTGPQPTPSLAVASSAPASLGPEPSPSPVGGTAVAPDSVVAVDEVTRSAGGTDVGYLDDVVWVSIE